MKKQIIVIEDIDKNIGALIKDTLNGNTTRWVYDLPEGIHTIEELFNSEDYKNFKEEEINKRNSESSLSKPLFLRGEINYLVGAGKPLPGIIDYLNHINQKR